MVDRHGAGTDWGFHDLPWLVASNITPDPETGIGNVSDDALVRAIREGIKEYGQWPTIPQLYIDGELVGGCDIVTGMFNSGELHDLLGVDQPDRTPPEITITPKAAEKIQEAMAGHAGIALHLQVDPNFQARFQLAPAEGSEISTEAGGITVLFDVASAQRARGDEHGLVGCRSDA